jgi:predicted PurR-regulated permease PerM
MAENAHDEAERGGAPAATGLVVLASLVVILAGIKAAEALIVPFLLAVFISIIVSPVMLWLRRHGVGSAVALVLMVAALVVVMLALTSLIGSAFERFRSDMPEYQRLLETKTEAMVEWLEAKGMEAPEQLLEEQINPQRVMRFAGNLMGGLSGVLGNSFLILLTVVFMLLEGSTFAAKLRALPEGLREPMAQYREVIASIRRYMAIKTVISLITGVLVTGLLMVLGIEYAVLWGLLAFVLNYIPNIGSILAAVPPMLLALVLKGVWPAVWVAAGYFAVNTLMGNLVEPRVMGRGVGLSPLVVFISLVFWGWLLGPVGMLLSVPLTMSVKIALSAGESTRFIALLLSPGAPEPSEAA